MTTPVTVDDITAAHNARLGRIDPLIAPATALDPADPGYLRAEAAGGAVEAMARFEQTDAASPFAVWGALRRHELDVRIGGDEPDIALGSVLDQWLDRIARTERPGDVDSWARVSVASRDIDIVNALLQRGFSANGVSAVRLRPRGLGKVVAPAPPAVAGAVIRRARVDDAPELGRLDEHLLALDAHFGGVTMRDGAAGMFTAAYLERLAAAPETTWVLERDGRITGFLHAVPHAVAAEPGAPSLALSGGQYLFVMYLDKAERGNGTGAVLARFAHEALDATGSPYTLLSYAAANPRSGPFWARMGYRPLVTDWQRRPAVLAR